MRIPVLTPVSTTSGSSLRYSLAGLHYALCQLRDNRSQDDTGQAVFTAFGALEQTEELQAVFIRHAGMIGCQPPVGAAFFACVQAEGQVGVADVYGEKH